VAIVLGTVTGTTAQDLRITAREVVGEIQKQVGVEWKKETVDTFKAGYPDTPVTGIAVTMMATIHRSFTNANGRTISAALPIDCAHTNLYSSGI
jgi:hypothetical protein